MEDVADGDDFIKASLVNKYRLCQQTCLLRGAR
jgi:hypothetical protein